MSGLPIRLMEEADIPQIVRLEKETYSDPWTPNMFKEHIKSHSSRNLVTIDDDKVFGYICTTFIPGYMLSIDNITVSSEERRRGLGTLLMRSIMDFCREKNMTTLTLEVRESNQTALGFYQELGFKIAGRRKQYYHTPQEDALIMSREGI